MTQKLPSIVFRLDPRSGVAPYRQLVDQVRQGLESGLLVEGDQLPSVREVVSQITINPNTVHRAYRDLEYRGIAEGRAGLGTFIIAHTRDDSNDVEGNSIEAKIRDLIADARRAGLDEGKVMQLVESALLHDGEVLS
jgi:GntR family transcriptional regulator